MFLLRLFAGFLMVVLGCGYLYQPQSILRFNAFMRDHLFKDAMVLLNGKKIGCILLFIGFLLLVLTYSTPR